MTRSDRKVYVSGSTGFLGKQVSKHLLDLGYSVVLGGKNPVELNKLIDGLILSYGELVSGKVVCDLSNPDEWEGGIKQLLAHELYGYVNCSGIQGRIASISELDVDEYTRVFNVNLFSPIFFTKNLLDQSAGSPISIIHFSGGGSTGARSFFAPYSLSKTALVRFVENVALENQSVAIKINAVAPGVMPSKMQEQILQAYILDGSTEQEAASKSMAAISESNSQVLSLVSFLLSEASTGITGKLISAKWDNWKEWPNHLSELQSTGLYTLRRMTARDLGHTWGDI